MRTIALLAMAALLAGCATQQTKPEVITAYVKVKEPCIAVAPPAPEYRTGKGAFPGDKAAAAILADDFEKAEQYGTAWETAAAGCIKKP